MVSALRQHLSADFECCEDARTTVVITSVASSMGRPPSLAATGSRSASSVSIANDDTRRSSSIRRAQDYTRMNLHQTSAVHEMGSVVSVVRSS